MEEAQRHQGSGARHLRSRIRRTERSLKPPLIQTLGIDKSQTLVAQQKPRPAGSNKHTGTNKFGSIRSGQQDVPGADFVAGMRAVGRHNLVLGLVEVPPRHRAHLDDAPHFLGGERRVANSEEALPVFNANGTEELARGAEVLGTDSTCTAGRGPSSSPGQALGQRLLLIVTGEAGNCCRNNRLHPDGKRAVEKR